jgi:hypothetical protein
MGMDLDSVTLIRVAALFCLSSALGFAESWSGALVDSKCYGYLECNVNPTDTMTYVDRDKNSEIRYCSASAKTKSFAVVLQDGLNFDLDTAGNAKAADLVRSSGKKSLFVVIVTGEMTKRNTVKVDSILMAR